MDFKSFMQAVEKNLAQLKSEEELRSWVKNYARSLPEEEREDFLEQLQKKESGSHKEKLPEIIQWCEKINDEELVLHYSDYESYGSGYWSDDWVIEYSDPKGIGPRLKRYYEEAEQAVYDGDYLSASLMYSALGALKITAVGEEEADPVELDVEGMVEEGLVSLDLKKIAELTLYATYQAYELPERVPRLYGFFPGTCFRMFP